MNKLTFKYDTFAGTGNAVCKYGSLGKDTVVSFLGTGDTTPVYLAGAGHHSDVTTWVTSDPALKGFLRSLCRDYALRRAAFFNRTSLKDRLQRKWLYK